jgi:sugar transferase EpsL
MLKRTIDLIASFLGLLVLSPILGVVAVLVRLKLGTPVLFVQVRPGLRGKPFRLFKFRTMTDQRNPDGNLLDDEVRLTSFGKLLRKLSLDELPQLFNVLTGKMSLVGPRPLLMEYLDRYTTEQARRHNVKPGITGWAQVNGRNGIVFAERFKLDVWYVDNQSFALDMKILWMTLLKTVAREGINQQGDKMEIFLGTKGSQK